jgi:hypothetical protein
MKSGRKEENWALEHNPKANRHGFVSYHNTSSSNPTSHDIF